MRRKAKRKFNFLDLFISILFSLFLSFYVLPFGVNYAINTREKIPYYTKQNILIAGKKYINNNNTNKVTIDELLKSGYLSENKELDTKNCFTLISTVNKINNKYYLNLNCINDESILVLAE